MREDMPRIEIAPWTLLLSLAVLGGVVAFVVVHFGEARRFALLVEHAQPVWLVLAVALQLLTYACAGGLWGPVVADAGLHLDLLTLGRLAVEKLSVDQLVPTGGLSGNVVVAKAMRRRGVPASVATEALLIDILSYYAAYAVVTGMAFATLWLYHDVTEVVLVLVVALAIVLAAVPLLVAWLLSHRDYRPGPRLARVRWLTSAMEAIREVSPERVRNARLLAIAMTLSLATFLLDAGTLWALLRATGTDTHVLTAFVALVVASLAGTFSFLPGGVGSFEAGCTATLALLGVTVEAALTVTLLLRGLTLWLPLGPGLLLARRDLAEADSPTGAST